MEKTIIIRDYQDSPTTVTIEDFETVGKIYIHILSGDEVLHVFRKDYSEEVYDSSDCRIYGFDDGQYDIYWPDQGINLLDNPKWCECTNSYDRMHGDYEEGA